MSDCNISIFFHFANLFATVVYIEDLEHFEPSAEALTKGCKVGSLAVFEFDKKRIMITGGVEYLQWSFFANIGIIHLVRTQNFRKN